VLNSVAVEAALNHLARRQGVVVRDQLLLRGVCPAAGTPCGHVCCASCGMGVRLLAVLAVDFAIVKQRHQATGRSGACM
jgi:hypothetical protein